MSALKGAARDEKALELRRKGLTFVQIGVQLQVGTTTAWRAYQRALRRHPERATVEEARDLELQRLDEMLVGLWSKATRGDTDAVDRVLKISQRRARLLGLDVAAAASVRAVPEDPGDQQPGSVSSIEKFRARHQERRGA